MIDAEQLLKYAVLIVIVLALGLLVDGMVVFGSPAYAFPYSGSRFCSSVSPGMQLSAIESKVTLFGRPDWIHYDGIQFVVGSIDSQCILGIDPVTNRVLTVETTGPAIQF